MVAVYYNGTYCNGGDGASTGYYALTQWATATAKTVGQIVRQLAAPAVNSERCFVCVVAGTTHATTEPTWVTTLGAKTTDNTVTWQECSGNPTLNGDGTNTTLSSAWRAITVSLGQTIKNNTATHYFICTTAGTPGVGEPAYNTSTGATTADNTATWTCLGAVGSFTTIWAAPTRRIQIAHTLQTNFPGNAFTTYVSAAHTETYAGTTTITGFNATAAVPLFVTVLQSPASIPPGSADVTTGASVTNSSLTLTVNGNAHYWGFTFGSPTLTVGSTQQSTQRHTNGTLNLTTGTLTVGGAYSQTEFVNTTVNWSGAATFITLMGSSGGRFRWRDTANAVSYASTMAASLFSGSGNFFLEAIGVDFSAYTGVGAVALGILTCPRVVFTGCKFASTVTLVTSTTSVHAAMMSDFINCDSGGAIYRHERGMPEGTQKVDTAIVRTSGASDGTTPISWKIVTSSLAIFDVPFEAMPNGFWNATTGSAVTLTIEALYNGAALPTNDQIWVEGEFFGTAASTKLSRATGSKTNPLASGSALTASTVAWDSAATARANSHLYQLGEVIAVSSNTSRVFVCTVAGTSSGSLPGGYASAVDGGTVTDGTATFRAAVRCKLVVVCTSPQSAGFIRAIVKVAVPSSTVWVDPLLTVS